MYPEISIQNVIEPSHWWIKNDAKDYRRGRLIQAFVPHVDQIPYTVTATGRSEASVHDEAYVRIEPLRIGQIKPEMTLPVAAFPCYYGEVRTLYRSKKRPVLIVSEGGEEVPKELTRGKPKLHTAPTLLVAPYYGGDEEGARAGYRPEFLQRVRQCEFPQFVWDSLPLRGPKQSVLRLDHIQPIGRHHESIEWTEHCLSDDAMEIIDEWITWILNNKLPKNGLIIEARKTFLALQ
jgi:hypothetical protein